MINANHHNTRSLGTSSKRRCVRFLPYLFLSLLLWSVTAYAQDLEIANDAFAEGDYVAALEIYETLAANGDAQAQYRLGLMFEQGLGTDVDAQASQQWFERAAQQNSPQALDALATKYRQGSGVIQNFKEALRLYLQAAEQGYPRAQHNLGSAFADGKGTFRDPIKAHMWFNLAAANGYSASVTARDRLASIMAESEITRAQDRALACLEKKYRGC